MPTVLTPEELLCLIDDLVKRDGATAVSARLGVTPQYISDIFHGRRDPGPKVVEALGFEKKITYHKKDA